MEFTHFEAELLKRTHSIINEIFKIEYSFSQSLYHYTSCDSAKKIIDSQQIKLSFIRSTSDPLELSSILINCRDWMCFHDNYENDVFPFGLFKLYSDEANNPQVRPYFFSMSHSENLTFLKEGYGSSIVKISPISQDEDSALFFKNTCRLIECKYEVNVPLFVANCLDRWNREAFIPTLQKFGIKDKSKNIHEWHFVLMEFCFSLALGIKSKAYHREEEKRLVVIPREPDQSSKFYVKRKLKPNADKFVAQREYLTLNLANCGLFAENC